MSVLDPQSNPDQVVEKSVDAEQTKKLLSAVDSSWYDEFQGADLEVGIYFQRVHDWFSQPPEKLEVSLDATTSNERYHVHHRTLRPGDKAYDIVEEVLDYEPGR